MKAARIPALDILRGFIMALMAIDHASNFIAKVHYSEFWGYPLPEYAGGLGFLTRYITHLCAPGFFLLMGAGMSMFAANRLARGWTNVQVIRHFSTRGLLLFLLTYVEAPAWLSTGAFAEAGVMESTPHPGVMGPAIVVLGVLYALGSSMLIWSFLLRLPNLAVFGLSIGAILITQFLVPSPEHVTEAIHPLWRFSFISGQTGIVFSMYPTFAWFGLCGFGILLGRFLLSNTEQTLKRILPIGLGLVGAYLLIRVMGGFGNLHTPTYENWIAFLKVTKYPPSIAFITYAIGINLILLYLFHKLYPKVKMLGTLFMPFGKTALFFYLLHLYIYALMGIAFPSGTSLPIMYVFWLIGLVILYPLCIRYAKFKHSRSPESLWRFL